MRRSTTSTRSCSFLLSLGRRTSVTNGNGVGQSFAFDLALRLQMVASNLARTMHDVTATFYLQPGQPDRQPD